MIANSLWNVLKSKEFLAYRLRLAERSNLPKYLFDQLSQDTNVQVLQTLALNPYTPKSILLKLIKSRNVKVRRVVVMNPNLSRQCLGIARKDSDQHVSTRAFCNPSFRKGNHE
jgi:hypothetical protein